jgi:hypothetical protein
VGIGENITGAINDKARPLAPQKFLLGLARQTTKKVPQEGIVIERARKLTSNGFFGTAAATKLWLAMAAGVWARAAVGIAVITMITMNTKPINSLL